MFGIPRRIACIATLLASSAALAQSPPAAATGGGSATGGNAAGRIGIGTIGPSTLAADLRIKIEDAAAAGLIASGANVVSAADLARARTTAALGDCADSVCEQRLAEITYTQYWLRGLCGMETSNYRLHFELVDARSGAVVASRDDTCDICTESDVAETTRVAAQALRTSLMHSPGAVALQAPTETGPTGATTISSGPEGKTSGSRKPMWRRVVPWVAFAGAAAAIGSGVYAITLDGKGWDCMPGNDKNCRHYHQTVSLGVPLIAIGAVLAAGGIVLLALPADSGGGGGRAAAADIPGSAPQMLVSVSTSGITVSGSF